MVESSVSPTDRDLAADISGLALKSQSPKFSVGSGQLGRCQGRRSYCWLPLEFLFGIFKLNYCSPLNGVTVSAGVLPLTRQWTYHRDVWGYFYVSYFLFRGYNTTNEIMDAFLSGCVYIWYPLNYQAIDRFVSTLLLRESRDSKISTQNQLLQYLYLGS